MTTLYSELKSDTSLMNLGDANDALYQNFYAEEAAGNIEKIDAIEEFIKNNEDSLAMLKNAELQDQKQIDYFRKLVNEIYLNTFAKVIYDFTQEQTDILLPIATKYTPWEGGDAVYIARYMLKLVLLANPQATRSSKVWDALYARHNPLPDSWIDEIKQGIEIISPRTELEANIGYYAGQYQQYTDVLKNYYLSDTTESATDSLIAVLSNTGSASDAYELAMVYLNNGRVDDGVQLLENMTNTNMLQSEEEIYRYYQTMSYFNIIKKIKSDNFRYGDLSQQELDWIYLTSENDDAPYSGNAKAIRMMYEDNYEYYEPVYYPNEEEMRKAKHKPGETISKSLILMPNPAKDYTIVNYSISEILTAEACIEIYDALGRMQSRTPISRQSGEELIDCSQMNNGSYLLILKNNGKTINKAKFVVTH